MKADAFGLVNSTKRYPQGESINEIQKNIHVCKAKVYDKKNVSSMKCMQKIKHFWKIDYSEIPIAD